QELRRLAPRLALGAGMDRCSGPLEITHGRVLKGGFNSLPSALWGGESLGRRLHLPTSSSQMISIGAVDMSLTFLNTSCMCLDWMKSFTSFTSDAVISATT